jgi:predicted transcriptional regulator
MTQTGPVPTGLIPLNDATADRLKRIAEAAYRRAQSRNFAPGHDLEDWLEAEKEIDAAMKSRPAPGRSAS